MSKTDIVEALEASITAINDWLNLYAPEHCRDERVAEARERISSAGGTLAYIAAVQEKNRAALSNARSVPPSPAPDGWVTVPKEPTEEMLNAGYYWDQRVGPTETYPMARGVYRGMISAAPAAPNGWCNIQDDPPPKDGRWILATNIGWHGDCEVLGWHFGAWRKTPSPESGEYTITHWMPLPAAPAEARDE